MATYFPEGAVAKITGKEGITFTMQKFFDSEEEMWSYSRTKDSKR